MLVTPNLTLPYIDISEAQREVVHNSAIRGLDALVHLAVLDRDLASPPGSPSDGQRWIVAASPTGAWAGHALAIAAWQDGAWRFYAPRLGWLVYVVDEGRILSWSGTAWVDALSMVTVLQNLALLGIGTTADATNPFSAKLNNALWTAKTVAEGGDGNLRAKMSKESAAKTLSLLMQNNFSGRAEIGLTGDDDFHFKVSPDGTTFAEAIVIDKTTAQAKFSPGSAAAPSITFNGDADTGFYRIGANNIGVAVNGAKVLDVSTTGLGVTGILFGGSAASSTLTLQSTTGTGTSDAIVALVGNNGATEGFRVVSGGQVVKGHTAAIAVGANTPAIQLHGTGVTQIWQGRWSNDATPTQFIQTKSRGGIGVHTVVQSGDTLANNQYYGSDGTGFILGASIRVDVDAAPGTGSMPSRMLFNTTATGAGAVTERLRLDSLGNVTIGTAALATGATDGFIYIPTCAGTPTGTPTAYSGRVPIVYDTANNKLYVYNGAWKGATHA
ncbi:MAG: hypothetical protein QOC56_1227 [Alphaproteobacteria bacterium]|nr:hypothetical protein [Alphaproteobacteria bacterium]